MTSRGGPEPSSQSTSTGFTGAGASASTGVTGAGATASNGSTKASQVTELAINPMRVVMKVLYAARYARPDLLRACTYLALYFTKWTPECDKSFTG